jgi:hypothetical protein
MLTGVSPKTKEDYGVAKYPSLRLVDREGRRAGEDIASLERALRP